MSPEESELRLKIVGAARAYLGVPFHHGQACEFGMDCVGLIRAVAADLGFRPYNPGAYPRGVFSSRTLEIVTAHLVRGSGTSAGSIGLFFHPRLGTKRPNHLAIFSLRGLIHSTDQVGRVVEVSLSDDWIAHLHSTWDFHEVAALQDREPTWQP